MEIRFSYDQRFDNLLGRIKRKYGESVLRFSGVHPDQLDVASFTRDFLFGEADVSIADRSVDGNANVDDRSVVSFDHEMAKAENKLNALNMIWTYMLRTMTEQGTPNDKALRTANEAIEDIITCALYLNDSHFAHKAYCYSFDLAPLVMEGMPFVKKIKIGPPKHFSSMINLVVQSTAFISNQIAGAASYPNLLIYLDYFARKDFGDRYWESSDALNHVLQGFQNLVYSLNFSFRGSQSAFTNVSIYDKYFLKELFSTVVYPDGSPINMESVQKIQRLFIDWYNQECQKQIFTFPVITANLVTVDGDIKDEEFLDYVSEANLPFGLLNLYTGPATCLSSCCRLRSELIREHTNSLGTGSVSIGSHRVCTINLPRIAIEAEGDYGKFFQILERRTELTHAVLNAHRQIIKDLIATGRLPLYNYNWMHLQKQYSTVGLIGPYEACKFIGLNITDPDGTEFVIKIMDSINAANTVEEKRASDGRRFNLELIPGEQAAIRMCEADKMLYPSFTNKYSLYSNQFIPLIEKTDLYTRMYLQGKFDSRAQGGCIMHLNLDHRVRNKEQMKRLIRSSASAGALYFAVNLNIAMCDKRHVNVGKITICTQCGGPITSNMTRVVGFITNVSDWAKVRRWEYKHRHFYDPSLDIGDEQVDRKIGEVG